METTILVVLISYQSCKKVKNVARSRIWC